MTRPQAAGRHAVAVPGVARDAAKPHTGEACARPVVKDKMRAHVCEWFQARPAAHSLAADKPRQSPRSQIHALFGNSADSRQTSAALPRDALRKR